MNFSDGQLSYMIVIQIKKESVMTVDLTSYEYPCAVPHCTNKVPSGTGSGCSTPGHKELAHEEMGRFECGIPGYNEDESDPAT